MNYPTWPSNELLTISPSDTTVHEPAIRQIYVANTGNVAVEDEKGNQVTFVNVPSGFYLTSFFVKKVLATGTTANGLIGFK